MTPFKIGDEEYSEEINTSYDQTQPIGDTPSNYPAVGSEPIDAPTGKDFYDIQIGGRKEGFGEFQGVWKQLGYEVNDETRRKIKSDIERSETPETYEDLDRWADRLGVSREDYHKVFEEGGYMYEDEFNNVYGEEVAPEDCNHDFDDKDEDPQYRVCRKCGQVGYSNEAISEDYDETFTFSKNDDEQEGVYTCKVCGNIFDYYDFGAMDIHAQKHIDGHEKLNKDGTGTANAKRGLDPNNKKHVMMKFDYVSQSGCDICAYYDEKTFSRDSPNRPVIPRLEKGDGERPYTHPNCKCRWTKVITGGESMANEIHKETVARARKIYGDGFDKLSKLQQNMIIIRMLQKSINGESEDPIKTARRERTHMMNSLGIDNITLKELGLFEADEMDPSMLADPAIIEMLHHMGMPIHDIAKDIGMNVMDALKSRFMHETFVEQEHPRDHGKFTTKGNKSYNSDFGMGTPTKNKGKVVNDISRKFPKMPLDFISEQVEKADQLRNLAIQPNMELKNEMAKIGGLEISGRIKEAKSMVEKIGRKPDLYGDVENLNDVSGVRAMAKDLNGVQNAMDYVRNNYNVLAEKNNIDHDRDGYRSYHAIIEKDGVKSEIQIRTKNQDKWANFVHDNFYKPANRKLVEFYNINKELVTSYTVSMSKYLYEKDMGLNPQKPECPPQIEQLVGCMN